MSFDVTLFTQKVDASGKPTISAHPGMQEMGFVLLF